MASPIINTRADLDATKTAAPAQYAQFVALLKGSLKTRVDTQSYPNGYDCSLTEGAEGYLAPVWVEQIDAEPSARFGFSVAEVEAL